jgi:Holliday junction resolvasome RuvABC ATP-dependent DNA helicase subunit
MLYFEMQLTFEAKPLTGEKNVILLKLNEALEATKFAHVHTLDSYLIAYDASEAALSVVIACDPQKTSFAKMKTFLVKQVRERLKVTDIVIAACKEMTTVQFEQTVSYTEDVLNAVPCNVARMINVSSKTQRNEYFTREQFISDGKYHTLRQSLKRAKQLLADDSFIEEIQRIYSPENASVFIEHPVHYTLTTGCHDAAMDMIALLVDSLYAKKRVLSRRVDYISHIMSGCYDEPDLDELFQKAAGTTIVIDMSNGESSEGNYASMYEQVYDYFDSLIKAHRKDTLFILLLPTAQAAPAKQLVDRTAEYLRFIQLEEGLGTRADATAYLKELIQHAPEAAYMQGQVISLPEDTDTFRISDVHQVFREWRNNALTASVYKAYGPCIHKTIKTPAESSRAYNELMGMIGLPDIKRLVDQMIATFQMRRLRTSLGIETSVPSQHMLFAGNPGSAKTTVARLLARILKDKGLLSSGAFIECGRSDLVAKYVGWTAKTIHRKFREASGGILFIDEAYSLVDDSHTFGDEAINTIVQEMENARDNVIVIFAGYPENMKTFLERNEGLRSRIAFHLDFPDYDAQELQEILVWTAQKEGYHLTPEAVEKCRTIFTLACTQPNFGNGRFVRNLYEQALMAQSLRIMKNQLGQTITKAAITELQAQDFEMPVTSTKGKKVIGF